MKRQFVIECDTAYNSLFVYEVSMDFSYTVDYHRKGNAVIEICHPKGPKFYGMLDALLVTASDIEEAKPITPVKEEVSI